MSPWTASLENFNKLLTIACASPAFAQSEAPSTETATQLTRATLREYLELISIPNDSASATDIQKNAAWLEAAFKKRGFTTRQFDNQGKPMLFAEWPKKIPGAKTALYYMHIAVQSAMQPAH